MKWKEKDDLSWCCVSRRRSNDDDESKYPTKQIKKVVLMQRSAEEVSSPVKKVKKKREKEKRKEKRKEKGIKKHLCYASLFLIFIYLFSVFALFNNDNPSSYLCLSATYFFYPKGLST
jgi:hypothetical protein